ncbi:hypothetical protein A3860_17975 [Niastella vici]|uniref:Uncharacterized protein n=1 Tax=Niastella vici TaxID=1703345 RepID=A0A1V9G4S3_9BACT|nr:hypothetical protein [Niastella vici]OQP65552.1 hypothetical protein A3860_17975 [Niastella vici]
MEHKRIALLIFKHKENELTADEQCELNEWLNANPKNRAYFNKVSDPAWFGQMLDQFFRAAKRKVYKKIRRRETRRLKFLALPTIIGWLPGKDKFQVTTVLAHFT